VNNSFQPSDEFRRVRTRPPVILLPRLSKAEPATPSVIPVAPTVSGISSIE